MASRPTGMAGKTTAAATRHDLRGARIALGWAGSLTKDDCAMADTPETTKPKLTPANDNPWYVLLTLSGECTGNESHNSVKSINNKLFWNSYILNTISNTVSNEIKDIEFNKYFKNYVPISTNEIEKIFYSECKNRNVIHNFPSNINEIHFFNILFDGLLNFSGMIFPRQLEFTDCLFNNIIIINNSYFHKQLYISNCEINEIELRNCYFNKYFRYISNNTAYLDLERSTIKGTAYFSRSNFNNIDFNHTLIDEKFLFNEVIVQSGADFSNSTIKGLIDFSRSKFSKHVPNFHEAILHSDTNWLDVEWPPPSADRNDASRQVRNFQRLKQMMETLKKHEDELNFFAMEMAAQRVVDGGWGSPRGILNGLYGTLSDYGRSVARPLVWLGFVVWACFVGLLASGNCAEAACGTIARGKAFALSATSALGFLPMKKEIFANLDSLSPAAHGFMAANTVLSFILLFLAGLGLRNRFRMK